MTNKILREQFADRLRYRMDEMGLSVSKLSFLSQVTVQKLSNYLKATNWPNAMTLIALADALGVSVDWLLGRKA